MRGNRLVGIHRRGDEPEFHLFIDETRTRDQFCLVGCILRCKDHHDLVHNRFEAIKQYFFQSWHTATRPIVFHRKEITNGEPPFSFRAAPQQREKFQNELVSVLSNAPFTVISSVSSYDRSLAPPDRA